VNGIDRGTAERGKGRNIYTNNTGVLCDKHTQERNHPMHSITRIIFICFGLRVSINSNVVYCEGSIISIIYVLIDGCIFLLMADLHKAINIVK
jgi:hypothetical protein